RVHDRHGAHAPQLDSTTTEYAHSPAVTAGLSACPGQARLAAHGSTVASILRIMLSRTVSTITAKSRRSANASTPGPPAGPLTSVGPDPRYRSRLRPTSSGPWLT